MPITLDVITSANLEINNIGAGETLDANDASWGLEKLQRLIDKLNAVRQAIFGVTFSLFTLIPNQPPHTIGPGGDFNVAFRPVRIPSANFILNAGNPTNAVDSPWLHIQDSDWWAALPTKSLTSSVVVDLYYDPAVPLGNLNFWPIWVTSPTHLSDLEMWTNISYPLTTETMLPFPAGLLGCDCAQSRAGDVFGEWNRAEPQI